MKKALSILGNCALLIFSVGISAAGVEIIARNYVDFSKEDLTSYVSRNDIIDNLVLGTPGRSTRQVNNTGDYDVSVKFNKYGLRDSLNISTSSAEDFLVVGDSFTMGHGVEEDKRFSNILRLNHEIPTYNVAIPTGLDGYKALIQYAVNMGSGSKNLILGICMENDLEILPEYIKKLSQQSIIPPKIIFPRVKQWLTKNSAFYFLATRAVHGNPNLKDLLVKAGVIDPPYIQHDVVIPADIKASAHKISELAKGRTTYIVIIPSRYNWYGSDETVSFTRDLHEDFVRTLRENGLNVIDIRPVFEAISSDPLRDYHFKYDGHWNDDGHAAAASAIASELKK